MSSARSVRHGTACQPHCTVEGQRAASGNLSTAASIWKRLTASQQLVALPEVLLTAGAALEGSGAAPACCQPLDECQRRLQQLPSVPRLTAGFSCTCPAPSFLLDALPITLTPLYHLQITWRGSSRSLPLPPRRPPPAHWRRPARFTHQQQQHQPLPTEAAMAAAVAAAPASAQLCVP